MEQISDSTARNTLLAELKQMRADAEAATLQEQRAHASAVSAFCDSVVHLTHRIDALERKRKAQLKAEAKRRAAEEAKAIQDRLDALPNPDNPNSYECALTAHPPSHEVDKRQRESRQSHINSD
jgi:hypothetical protein